MMPSLVPGEVGVLAAESLSALADRALGGAPIATYVEGSPMPWSVIADGGWDTIGIPEGDGGGGATLLDLATAARAWGQTCIPLPFVVSTMAKRWSVQARQLDGPVSIAVPQAGASTAGAGEAGASDVSGRAPFGCEPGVVVLRGLSEGGQAPAELVDASIDDFAPSLRLAQTSWSSTMDPAARLELGIVWAAEATGCGQRLLDLSVGYAKERQQFGRPIGSFQAIKHRLADMRVSTEAAETAVIWAAVSPDEGARAARYALDESIRVAESAIQVHGGMGFTWELGLHYYLRHVVTLRELVHGLWR